MIDLIKQKLQEVKNLCLKHSVKELYLFGSAVTGLFHKESDIDFAVVFDPTLDPLEHGSSFFNLMDDLQELFERPIDLISYRALKNPIFKEELDNSKVSLYAA